MSIYYICINGKHWVWKVSDSGYIIEPCDQWGPGSPHRQYWWQRDGRVGGTVWGNLEMLTG